MDNTLIQHIEALVFSSAAPIHAEEIKVCVDKVFETDVDPEDVKAALDSLQERYADEIYALELVHINEGYQFLTKGAYHEVVGAMLRENSKKRLSRVALETMSIIAYKQPVTKSELEQIRGVSCDYALEKLLEKELVEIQGRAESPGRPLLYGTTAKFMDYFGLGSLRDLPQPKEFALPDNQIGALPAMEELQEVSIGLVQRKNNYGIY